MVRKLSEVEIPDLLFLCNVVFYAKRGHVARKISNFNENYGDLNNLWLEALMTTTFLSAEAFRKVSVLLETS